MIDTTELQAMRSAVGDLIVHAEQLWHELLVLECEASDAAEADPRQVVMFDEIKRVA